MMNSDNALQAVSCYNGLFSDAELTIQGFSVVNHSSPLHIYINENFSLSNSFVDSINYKGIHYSNVANHSILLYSEKEKNFGVGIIKKIVIKNVHGNNQQIFIVYQKTILEGISTMGLYSVKLENIFCHIPINELANHYPLYLYTLCNSSKDPTLYLSLRTMPYLK